MGGQGGGINWMWVILGSGAAVVVVLLLMNNNNNASTQNQTVPAGSAGVTSNTGTGPANGSYVGYTDPASGINWILDASNQWVSALPTGSLPPNYTPGAGIVSPTNNNVLAQL